MNILEKVTKTNPQIIKLITSAINNQRLAHAFIFSAANGLEINDEPILLISSIIEKKLTDKNHSEYSDLIIIDGKSSVIKKEEVIKAINKMHETPLDKRGFRILLIKNIENGNKQSLNSLLKFIEEPKDKTFILMTTNNLPNVLDTIKSRSQIINLKIPNKDDIENLLGDLPMHLKKIIVAISKTSEEAIKFSNSKQNIDLIKLMVENINLSSKNIDNLIIELNKILSKKNYKIVISVLRLLFKDVWRYKHNQETITGLDKIFFKYKDLNYQKILKALSAFSIIIKRNGNFELAKTRLLIEIGEKNE